MRLQTKVVATSVGGIVVTATAIVGLLFANKGRLRDQISAEVTALGQESCKRIALDVEQMLNVYHRSFLQNSLKLADELIAQDGGIRFRNETVAWQAVNQFTKAAHSVELPQVAIGETPIHPNTDPAVPSPIVDKVQKLTGARCTIFQRMNTQGDMLRICTNVPTAEGKRAIGT